MEIAKQLAMEVLQAMPDDCTWDQIRYRLYLYHNIEMGKADIVAGRTIPHEVVVNESLKS